MDAISNPKRATLTKKTAFSKNLYQSEETFVSG